MATRRKKKGFFRRCFNILMLVIGLFLTISIGEVVLTKWININYTPLMLRRKIEARKNGETLNIKHTWIDFQEISANMPRAVMAAEDDQFLLHNGFSEKGLRRAYDEYQKKGVVRHGGSTISQQTAKNAFTFGTRSYLRKALEAYYTFLIEKIWGKKRIMEVYLNIIEMGDGIFGIEAASQAYYHHSAQTLSATEAATIAVCLPNPHKMHPNRPSSYVIQRRSKITGLMPKLGKLDFDNPENSDLNKRKKKEK